MNQETSSTASPPGPVLETVRIDKWLWAVRLFPTRSAATEGCRAGHVKVRGESVKPAREARVGDVVTVQFGPVLRTVRIRGLLQRRVGAKVAHDYAEDLTPPEEYAKRTRTEATVVPVWERGRGRPTKRDRRKLDGFLDAT